MQQLSDEKILLELLELAKEAEKSARETCEIATKIAYKWQKCIEERVTTQEK